MKKHNSRSFLSGVLVTLFAVALVGTAAATVGKQMIEVDYADMSIFLNGSTLKLTDANGKKVEPFAYNGTTYVPVRAIASAFGADVQWYKSENSDSQGIGLLTAPSALTSDYPFTGAPRLDGIVGNNAFWMSFAAEEGNTDRTYYSYAKSYFKDGTADAYVSLYDAALKVAGFKLFQTSTLDGSPMYHYVNDSTKVFVSFYAHKIEGAEYVSVLVNTEQQKTTSGGSSSTSPTSPGSTSGTPATSTPDDPYADNDYVVDVPNFDGKCPHCGVECFRDRYINDTVSVWYYRNPKCTYYEQRFQA